MKTWHLLKRRLQNILICILCENRRLNLATPVDCSLISEITSAKVDYKQQLSDKMKWKREDEFWGDIWQDNAGSTWNLFTVQRSCNFTTLILPDLVENFPSPKKLTFIWLEYRFVENIIRQRTVKTNET